VVVRDREAVRARLSAAGIPTAVHYPLPANEQPAYRAADTASTPVAAWLARHVMSLPMGPDLAVADQDRVVECVLEACGIREAAGRRRLAA
jgi:UDP-2-acetamido-2-deoxy-ribo-hexuluronate aminotransferase